MLPISHRLVRPGVVPACRTPGRRLLVGTTRGSAAVMQGRISISARARTNDEFEALEKESSLEVRKKLPLVGRRVPNTFPPLRPTSGAFWQ